MEGKFEFKAKAQSAIEYLMTYGWMLLVVAIAGGTIYSVTNGQDIESISGFTGKDISIEGYGITTDENLQLELRNTANEEIDLKSIELEDSETGATTKIYASSSIDLGSSKAVEIEGIELTDSTNDQELRVNYDSKDLSNITIEGTLTGNLRAKNNIYLQNIWFNQSKNSLNFQVENTGASEASSIEYSVSSDEESFKGNLGNLSPGKSSKFAVNTGEIFSIQNISLNVEGPQFSNPHKEIKCLPAKGLVGYWSFEQDKNQLEDYSKFNNTGSANEAVEKVEGVSDSGIRTTGNDFDDSSNEGAVYIQDSQSLTFDKDFTVSLWAKNQDGGGLVDGTVLDKGAHFQNEEGAFTVHTGGSGYASIFVANGTDRIIGGTNADLQRNKWTHVGGAYKYGESLRTFSNGELDSNLLTNFEIKPNDYRMTVGRRTDWHNYAEVSVDKLMLYNRSLSGSEMQRLYSTGKKVNRSQFCKFK